MIYENSTTLAGVLDSTIRKVNKDLEVAIPCKVISTTSRSVVDVQPTIDFLDSRYNPIERSIIKSIPVATFGTSGLFLSFPIAVGDFGLLIACDRDISLFIQNLANSAPITTRMHDFNDALFIPLNFSNITVPDTENNNVVISDISNTNYISIGSSGININSTSVKINGIDVITHKHAYQNQGKPDITGIME